MAAATVDDITIEPFSVPRDARFFQPNLPSNRIPEAFAELLQEYSGIPRDEQVSHILTVRNKAYKFHPYPCLGRFRFLDLDLAAHPLYKKYVLPQLRAGSETTSLETTDRFLSPIFLDLGTCLGQDIRKLVYDGVSADKLYGADLDTSYVPIGYALFRDEGKFPQSNFLTGPGCDVLTDPNTVPDTTGLRRLDGQIDILNATAVFHLFDLENQKQVARRCLRLLRKPRPGTFTEGIEKKKQLILGGQAGNVNAGDSIRRDGQRKFRHNVESWRQMWEEVIAEDEWKAKGTKIEVWSELVERAFFQPGNIGPGDTDDIEEGDGKTEWNSKIVGAAEDGHRWHIYSFWVEFGHVQG